MQKDQSMKLINRRKAIVGLLATGAALTTSFATTPSSFAASLSAFATNPTSQKFKATIKTSKVALKHQKAAKKTGKIALKTYTLKTNKQAAPLRAADDQATFTAYPVNTTSSSDLRGIVKGDDGSSFWFTENGANRIGKITTQGAITEYLLPLSGYQLNGIANGPGDTFWFTYQSNAASSVTAFVGRMIGASGQVTLYSLPSGVGANDITRGPNDTLWFTSGRNQIGNITSDGAITIYTVDSTVSTRNITTGPDGALWFAYRSSGNLMVGVARLTTDGSVTFYPVAKSDIFDITAGVNNDLWFPIWGGSEGSDKKSIARITVDGTLTVYYIDSQIKGSNYPGAIARLGDGTFAFGTSQEDYKVSVPQYIGTITPAGDVQAFVIPNGDQVVRMVYAGWANEVWFTSSDNKGKDTGKIYKFRLNS